MAGTKRQAVATRIAAITRHNGPDDPRLPELRAQLREEELAAHITRLVNEWPPLSETQRERLANLLRGAS